MRRIVVSEYVTLDGVMENPGGWSFQFWNDEAAQYKFDELFASDALLLGRVTYEGFAQAWPSMKDEQGFADRMNSMPKYVVSRTLQEATWNNSTVIQENVVEAIVSLRRQSGQDILVAGSATLVHTLMQHNLVDEYKLMLHPVVLGSGKRLFDTKIDQTVLKLIGTQAFSSGIVILTYVPTQIPNS